MNIVDKLRRVLEIKNDIKAALEEKGIEVGDNFSSFADNISNISGGGGEEPEPEFIYTPPTKPVAEYSVLEWEKPSDWLDIETIAEENAVEGYPYYIAQLVTKEEATSILGGDYDNSDKTIIKTSDGNTINSWNGSGYNSIEYTWTDEGNDSNYRWVIHYYNTQTISFNNALAGCLWLHLGGGIRVRTCGATLAIPGGNAITTSGHGIWLRKSDAKETIRAITGSGKILGHYSKNTVAYRQLFEDWDSLEYLSPDIFDQAHMEQCTDFTCMFNNCYCLTQIPQLYTSNGTIFQEMFPRCKSIKTIPSINTELGENFYGMFINCSSLIEVPVLNTSKGTSFSYMFSNCTSLKVIQGIDISGATTTYELFCNCYRLEYIGGRLDLSNHESFDSSNFSSCWSLRYIDEIKVPSFDVVEEAFNNIRGLQYIGKVDFSALSSDHYCAHLQSFYSLTGIGEITGTSDKISLSNMFYNCGALQFIPYFETSSARDFSYMFCSCSSLRTIPNLNFNNVCDQGIDSLFNGCSSLKEVPYFDTSKVYSFEATFSGCSNLKKVPLYNTSNVTNFINTFSNCSSLKEVPHFDTGQAQSLGNMFQSCSSLVYVPDFDTRNCGDFNGVFYGCFNLKQVPNFDYTMAYTFSNMFASCGSLTSIPVIDTSRAIDMSFMFSGCTGLTEFPNVTIPIPMDGSTCNISGMFSYCSNIKSLPYESIHITHPECTQLFDTCTKLESIPELIWHTDSTNVSNMFRGCKSLRTLPVLNKINWSTITNASGMFAESAIEGILELDLPNIEDFGLIIHDTINLKEVSITSNGYSLYNANLGKLNLNKINLHLEYVGDCSGFDGESYVREMVINLPSNGSQFTIPNSCITAQFENTIMYPLWINYDSCLKYMTISGIICTDWDLTNATLLTKRSLLSVLNALNPDHEGGTLTLGETNLAKLTEEEKAIATNKGWNLY